MKQIRPLITGLVACAVALAMVSSLSAQNAQQGLAKVVSIKGSARYMTSSNPTWQPLKTGDLLKSGTIVQTASGSYVDLVLNNPNAAGPALSAMTASSMASGASGVSYQPKAQQDAIRIFENTVLGIDKLMIDQTGVETVSETQLDLKAGSIFGSVKKLSSGSKYEIKIPNGVAGIRGTIYYITASGMLRVVTGSVVVAFVGPDGSTTTKVVVGGQQFDMHSGLITSILPDVLSDLGKTIHDMQTPTGAPHNLTFAPDYTFIEVSPH